MQRCAWARTEPSISYHDNEWGVPVHDDRTLFEFLILEGAQAGLSWETILKKRAGYRAAFDQFDPRRVSQYNQVKIAEILSNPQVVRNRLKIAAAVQNAKCFLALQQQFGSFDAYAWKFVGGRPIQRRLRSSNEVPCVSAESDAFSKDLSRRGFKFVGSKICYSFMQAVGMFNDHTVECFRYTEVRELGRR